MAKGACFAVCLIACVAVAGPASAQWASHPTPGIPRLADGKPDLNAPPPRTPDGKPDLSGVWQIDVRRTPTRPDFFFDLARDLSPADVVPTPWARGVQEQRVRRDHIDDPYGYCIPAGVPRLNVLVAPFKIVYTPAVTVMLYETGSSQTFRQVFTDGRRHPDAAEPTWLGYSVGQWEGTEFVVETGGFWDGGWLDTLQARPHSDALRVTERFRRPAAGRLEAVVTINDPKAYEKPWTVNMPFRLVADGELMEMTCENHAKTWSTA